MESSIIFKKSVRMEIVIIAAVSALFMLVFAKVIGGQSIFTHDSIRWYGVYHLFADSLSQGVFPYWNPFGFCGQPFYYNLGILRLYEPITVLPIMLNKAWGMSLLTLYHWEYMARIWFTALGVYVCFRQTCRYRLSALMLFGIFLFSSFTATSLRQNGVLYVFFWAPWAMYFMIRLLKKFDTYNVVGLTFFIGLSLTSYQGVYILTYFFIFTGSLLINKRGYLVSLFGKPVNILRIFLAAVVIVLLAAPLLSVAIEQKKIVPTARIADNADIQKGVILSYDSIEKAGTHSNIADFSELIYPVAARGYYLGWFSAKAFRLSECFLYIGILPFLLAVYGIMMSKNEYRINFTITLITVALLMLGPRFLVHPALYAVFYPLRLARHMHLFSPFFIFTFVYFAGQGMDLVMDKIGSERAEVSV